MHIHHQKLSVVIAVAGVLAMGCDDKKSDTDVAGDTQDDPSVDTVADTATDPVPDTAQDPATETAEDVVADTVTDPTADTAGDAETDPVEDPETDGEDASADPFEDWPTDLPVDWGTETTDECSTAGGFCTSERWVLCPSGYEPIDPDPHRGCGGSPGTAGWCCVLAPPSPCSASSTGNCIAAESCTGCWASVDLECEDGRVCCMDICD